MKKKNNTVGAFLFGKCRRKQKARLGHGLCQAVWETWLGMESKEIPHSSQRPGDAVFLQAEVGLGSLWRGCSPQKASVCPGALRALLWPTAHTWGSPAGSRARVASQEMGNQGRALDHPSQLPHQITQEVLHCPEGNRAPGRSSETSTRIPRFMDMSLFQGSVSPLKLPCAAEFVQWCSASSQPCSFGSWWRGGKNVWRLMQLVELGESCWILCLLGYGSSGNGLQIFQCQFASRFLQNTKHWKKLYIFSRKFHYWGALIPHKFCKKRQNDRRSRKKSSKSCGQLPVQNFEMCYQAGQW